MRCEAYKILLDSRLSAFDAEQFICNDPISVVYKLKTKLLEHKLQSEDVKVNIEIGALFVAMIAWGGRKQIIKDAERLMEWCGWRPFTFVVQEQFNEIDDKQCIHRTLFGADFKIVCHNLKRIFAGYDSLESYLTCNNCECDTNISDSRFKYVERLSQLTKPAKLGSVSGKSVCKRLCMFMRWMVRCDAPDLGVWTAIKPCELFAVMDVHVVRQAKSEGLLSKETCCWNSVVELTDIYSEWDCNDPLKYDMVMMINDI